MESNGSHSQPWWPSSWRSKPIKQAVSYPDPTALPPILSKLSALPGLVTPTEIEALKSHLRDVALGNALLLQGGDCAELFSYCSADRISTKIKLLLQMSLVLIWGSNKPVVRIARMAGQYAKPRSSPNEKVSFPETQPDGHIVHVTREVRSFRGDIINGHDRDARTPDPRRLLDAYFHSAATVNHMRGALGSGLADLHRPLDWGLGHVRDKAIKDRYTRIVASISDSLRFMETVGATDANAQSQLRTVELFTSHEGLLLEYEEMLTREMPLPENARHSHGQRGAGHAQVDKAHYALSAHLLWIGDRTRDLNGAHVEFFRGIANPIGIKVGPTMAANELVQLLDIVNPTKEIGKVTLITRYGAEKVEDLLGGHIDAVKASGHTVVWQCDPMHGNTHTASTGLKTRRFGSILAEVSAALRVHKEHGSFLGGVHLELTGETVTECTGGSQGIEEEDLDTNYMTYCDPRLNEKQALELAFLVAGHYRGET